ncbi:MAG: OFA family MFS transporter [Ascidiaceihabitans sp.]|nr:OFA family MFS transporter [Ascidiaceihabitans sp.]
MSSQPASGAFAFLMKENIVAKPGYNRWLVPPASIAIHMCIGSVYAWSVFNPALTRELGVVAASADDWSLSSVVWIFSVAIVFLGLAAAFGGKWLEKVGPRCVGVTAATLWGGGFIIGSLGITSHQLWLVYLGYGVFGGAGLGLGYVSPVSTLIRWFPDRRGMATGMAIMGFGGGAMIGAPLKQWLLGLYAKAPEFLGAESTLTLVTEGGRRFAETAQGKIEVIVATAAQAANLPGGGDAGVYAVGTGDTGAAATFMTLGIVYFCVMVFASFQYRVPAEGWTPEGWVPAPAKGGMVTTNNVHIDEALKTRQFWLLWIVLCFNVTAGIGVIGVAKTMINEIFGDLALVTAAFAGTYVLMISVFNMVGRFFWASTSDFIGRKNTYHCFFIIGIILYVSIPYFASSGGMTALFGFYAATMIIFTMYGGGFATIPAYLADMFGTLHVGGIHGRLLTAWSTAGVLGPFAITYLRNISKDNAITDLVSKIDPAAFAEKFGAPVADLSSLVAAKSVTIAQLLDIAPAGTIDPTSSLYNTTMYCMAALLVVGFFANLMIRPVNARHHVEKTHPEAVPAE